MKFRFPFKTEVVVAFAAITISMATLFVYIYQARIMQTQQQVAVWPYLECLPSWGDHGYFLQVTNKGVGPALVKKATIKLDGKELADLDELFRVLTDSVFKDYSYSTIQGRVIAPGEQLRVFDLWNKEIANRIRAELIRRNVEYELCYCSVFDKCWTVRGMEVSESKCN